MFPSLPYECSISLTEIAAKLAPLSYWESRAPVLAAEPCVQSVGGMAARTATACPSMTLAEKPCPAFSERTSPCQRGGDFYNWRQAIVSSALGAIARPVHIAVLPRWVGLYPSVSGVRAKCGVGLLNDQGS